MSYRILAQNTNILRVIFSDFIYCTTPQIHIEVEKVPTDDHFKRSRRDPPNPLRFLRENRCPMQPLMSHNDPISPLLSPFIPLAAGFPESKMVKMALSPQLSYHAAQCCMPPPPSPLFLSQRSRWPYARCTSMHKNMFCNPKLSLVRARRPVTLIHSTSHPPELWDKSEAGQGQPEGHAWSYGND